MNTGIPNPFFRFCQETLPCNGIEAALNKLHQRHQLNASILIYCSWCGESGRGRLSKRDLQRLMQAIAPWHQHIVQALNKLARLLRQPETPQWGQNLLPAIKTERVTAVSMEQHMLSSVLDKWPLPKRPPPQRLIDACENIATYCQLAGRYLDTCGCRAVQQLLIAAFPNFNPAAIEKLCFDTLLSCPEQPAAAQMSLPIN